MYTQRLTIKWYLACSMILTLHGPTRSTTTFLPLPSDWETLCPYTDFCTHRAAQPINLTFSQKPCCEPCSCEPDCGLRRNCCQYSMDRYRLDEKYQTTCTPLSTADNMFSTSQPRKTYMTVDKCPNRTSCYNFKAARWGSMFPVVSHETGMIYLNKQCASCHNEKNVTEWETTVNCHTSETGRFFQGDGLTNALNGNPVEPAQCFLIFLPPRDSDVDFQSCYMDRAMWRSCASQSNATELAVLCENFNATFFNLRKGFANVYCFLCSSPDKPTITDDACLVEDSSRTPNTPFSALLKTDMIQAMGQTVAAEDDGTRVDVIEGCRPNEVVEETSGMCRRLQCKSGQIELADRCEYLGNDWTVGPFQSFIALEPLGSENRFPVEELWKLSSYKGKFFRNRLPLWKRWLYYAAPKNESFVAYFVLIVYHERTHINPLKFLYEFRRSLDDIWSLKIDGNWYRMNASFHIYQDYNVCGTANKSFLASYDELRLNEVCNANRSGNFDVIRSAKPIIPYVYHHSIPLTELFYCDQVALKSGEYIDHGIRIFFKITGSFIEFNDFRRIPTFNGNNSIIVCLSTFGDNFWKNHKAVSTAHSLVLLRKFLCVFVCNLLSVYTDMILA